MHGRPSRDDSRRRTEHFLRLCAEGVRYDDAATLARVKTERALRIVSEPEFAALVDALRAAGVIAVVVAEPPCRPGLAAA